MSIRKKEPILFLVHRIPYPPNKGDKIRSFHLLKFLTENYSVFCGTFIDDPDDQQYIQIVEDLCEEAHFIALSPIKAKFRSLQGFLQGRALSIPYYASSIMQQWVNEVIARNDIKKILTFSSPMAQFVDSIAKGKTRVMDFVDIDSDKWAQYSQSHKGLMSQIYSREAKKLFEYEQKIARSFCASLFVSQQEAECFKQMVPDVQSRIHALSNGVDLQFFDPDITYPSPFEADKQVLVFTGAMDYWANCDAVIWFASEIFSKLREEYHQLQFYIVGSKPTQQVKDLANKPGVFVTGRVDDVRPYIRHAFLSVAPLRIARGIQNKVLEAMAMNKMVIATPNAMEGIDLPPEFNAYVRNSAKEQIELIKLLMNMQQRVSLEKLSGEWIKSRYAWDRVLRPLSAILEGNIDG